MTSPVSSLRSERTGARTGEGMDPPSFEEAERLLWRYLEEGTDIMFKHVSGKISRRLDRMSKSLDYLESSTTILVQRAKKKEIPTWGAELPAHAENLAAWSSETSLTLLGSLKPEFIHRKREWKLAGDLSGR
eukprot:765710-Hanusia_phi.AAC.3